jgi:hypothetical protein
MSTSGVRTRFVDLLVRGGGRVTEAELRALIDYARDRGITSGEAKALLQPASYLRTSSALRTRGIGLDAVRLDEGAWAAAEALGEELGISPLFPELPNARPGGAPQPSPGGGKSLGPIATWKLQTSGATVTFTTEAEGKTYPAVVLASPSWKDPEPARDLIAEHGAALGQVTSLAQLAAFARDVVARERAYFEAGGITVRYENERYSIQDARRHGFFEALAAAAARLALPAAERPRVPAVLAAEKERLLCDRDYEMETGSHTNYWPYWRNYRGAIEKLLRQTAPGTDEYLTIKNRLEDIYNRKTVFAYNRQIDEKNIEVTLGGALVYRPPYSPGSGHRASLAQGSDPTAPSYEVLSVAATGLPAGLEKHAGAQVYRDTDAARTLRLDPGGAKLSAGLDRHVQARKVSARDLGLRPFTTGESPRAGIAWDWHHNLEDFQWERHPNIDVAAIEIGWWGHCHNESPLNAMGIDPKRGVTLYRAARGIPAAQAVQTFTADDVWDLFGALTSDHELGYVVRGRLGDHAAEDVEQLKWAGNRNEGGHWFGLVVASPSIQPVYVDAEVTELWHKSDPTKKYDRPEERFRRDLPNADGTFDPNPDWIESSSRDDDEITIDCLGRRMTFTSKYITFGPSGDRVQVQGSVELDPTKDEWVKIGDEIAPSGPRGGKLIEHWYNAKQARYRRAQFDVGADGRRHETYRSDELPVTRAIAAQETTYDSVIDIHDLVTKNMGLPFTFDTSSGLAVWNYPVSRVRIDRTQEAQRTEGGKAYSYTSYHLRYTTMGGPAGEARYIIKRDERGNALRATALDPMPDFAYRNEHWVCAPVTTDQRGEVAQDWWALQAGYLTDPQRQRIVPDLWRRQAAICYASLAAPGGGNMVYAFEAEGGEISVFPDDASFKAAVDADRRRGSNVP